MPRLFVGLEIAHDIAEDIFRLRSPLPGARWTRAEDYHLTFRFLGDIDNRQMDEVIHALGAIDLPAFDIEFQGVGQFGGDDPKVVFADVRPNDDLDALSRAIDGAIRRAGLPLEKRNFRPHVTLARLRHSDPQPVARYLQRRIEHNLPASDRRLIEQIGVQFDPGLLNLRLREGENYFDGFGQSEDYFADIKDIIKSDLAIPAPTVPLVLEFKDEIVRTRSIGIHVRWFDDGIGPRTLNMQLDYYRQAIQNVNASDGDTKIFVFSDKPERAQFLLKPILDDYNWALIDLGGDYDNSINEFWLMSHCKQIIISNSTFAWWAAWLGEANGNTSKIVAPGRKIEPIGNVTAWGFPRLLPARWTII
jgi:2'-5' RNA ligase